MGSLFLRSNYITCWNVTAGNETFLGTLKPDTHDETFVWNFCIKFLCVSYTTVQTIKLLYANFTLPVALSRQNYAYMHRAFVNMVLTEEDEIVVPLWLIIIALAMQPFKGPRIICSCWTRRWIQRRQCILGLTMLWSRDFEMPQTQRAWKCLYLANGPLCRHLQELKVTFVQEIQSCDWLIAWKCMKQVSRNKAVSYSMKQFHETPKISWNMFLGRTHHAYVNILRNFTWLFNLKTDIVLTFLINPDGLYW